MSIYETTIKNPKKIAEFYKQLSEQKDIEIKQLKQKLQQKEDIINKAKEYIKKHLTDNGRFLMLNEWQVPDLLDILKEVE